VERQNRAISLLCLAFHFFVILSLFYDILTIPRTHNYNGWPICDARGDDFLRTCMGDKAGGCATYIAIEPEDDGPMAIVLNATLMGFWRELRLEPVDK
jgi:hypothetical protein